MNTTSFSVKLKRFWLFHMSDVCIFWFCLCSSHWFVVFRPQLEKCDVIYFHVPITIQKHLNQNFAICMSCLFVSQSCCRLVRMFFWVFLINLNVDGCLFSHKPSVNKFLGALQVQLFY